MSTWSLFVAIVLQGVAASESTQADHAALVARGATVYREQKCQACHSVGGVGNRRSKLDGVGTRLDAETLRKWIVAPQDVNPKVRKRAFDRLAKPDVDALVAYLQSLQAQERSSRGVGTAAPTRGGG